MDESEFFENYAPEPTTGCWLWMRHCARTGYGQVRFHGRMWNAHRVAWTLTRGPIPDGLCVCHKCDTPACINPDHLFLGTYTDNMRDAVKKDRMARGDRNGQRIHPERTARGDRSGARLHPESRPRGERHWTRHHPERIARGDRSGARTHPETRQGERNGRAKLSREIVAAIRQAYAQDGVSQQQLADRFGVEQTTVSRVVRGESWR